MLLEVTECLYVCQSKQADISEVQAAQSCLTLCDPHELYCPWNSPGQNTGVGSLSLFQGIFLTWNQTWVSCIPGGFFTI